MKMQTEPLLTALERRKVILGIALGLAALGRACPTSHSVKSTRPARSSFQAGAG